MPKKMGVNTKAEAARARKSATETERKEKETREKEEQYWREAEGSRSRAAKKKEEEAEKRAEAAARRAEARRLAEQEEKELEKSMKKVDKKANRVSIPVPKVTEAELRKRREEEQALAQKKGEEAKKRTAAEEEYERMVLVSNTNRDDSIIEARTLDDAIAQMAIADNNLPPDRHPERRLKASFKVCTLSLFSSLLLFASSHNQFHHRWRWVQAFEEAELPKLKQEKPGLTYTQYKDMIWKLWKKSPDNPLNQVSTNTCLFLPYPCNCIAPLYHILRVYSLHFFVMVMGRLLSEMTHRSRPVTETTLRDSFCWPFSCRGGAICISCPYTLCIST